MKRVREGMGLANVILIIPFCRRVKDGKNAPAEMAANGLVRGEKGLEVYVIKIILNTKEMEERLKDVRRG